MGVMLQVSANVTWFAYAVGLKETEEERRKYIRKKYTGKS
jgi:hypothetical protein